MYKRQGVLCAFGMTFSGNPYLMILGGFAGSFADDFLEVRKMCIRDSIGVSPNGEMEMCETINHLLCGWCNKFVIQKNHLSAKIELFRLSLVYTSRCV